MTGFGAADAQWESSICQVEIRSVNQRFLDIRCRLPLGFQTMEPEIKKVIKAVCSRGKIDCSIKLEKGTPEEKLNLNAERAQRYNELLLEFLIQTHLEMLQNYLQVYQLAQKPKLLYSKLP